MKKTFYRLLIIISFFIINNCNAQWVITNLIAGEVYTLYVHNGYIYTGSNELCCRGIYISPDYGQSWSYVSLNQSIGVFTSNGNNVYVSAENGIYRTSNNGINWLQVSQNNYGFYDITFVGNNFFAGTNGHGIYLSTDFGNNWTRTSIDSNLYVRAFGIKGNNLYVGALGGLYVTSNNGSNWTKIFNTEAVYSIAFIGDIIFAGTYWYGVYKSTNEGVNWLETSTNNMTFTSFALFTFNNNILMGGNTNTFPRKYAFLSSDSGNTWYDKSQGIGYGVGEINAFSLKENYIFAGISASISVLRRNISEITSVNHFSTPRLEIFSLSQNYPNPFNPTTTIKYEVAEKKFVTIKIYNILGKEIATLVNEKQSPGTYEVSWDGSAYPSGVYFYKLMAGDFTETKKMLMIK